jgi:hypothetical protein
MGVVLFLWFYFVCSYPWAVVRQNFKAKAYGRGFIKGNQCTLTQTFFPPKFMKCWSPLHGIAPIGTTTIEFISKPLFNSK